MRMHSVITAGIGLATALLVAGCGSKPQPSSATADTLTPKLAPVPQGAPKAAPATGDGLLLGQTTAGDSAELALGAYMEKAGSSKAVKAFAHNLVLAKTRRMQSAAQLATQLHVALPPRAADSVTAAATRTLGRLKTLAGNDRDTAFINHEVAAEQRDIAASKRAASGATAPQVKQFLASEIRTLEQHAGVGERLARLLSGVQQPGC